MSQERNETTGNSIGNDEIGRLLREAGRRPPIPPDDLAAIRAAARTAWGHSTAARRAHGPRRLGMYALAASLLLAALTSPWWFATRSPSAPDMIATVEVRTGAGQVALERDVISSIDVGDKLSIGTTLTTDGAEGQQPARLALRMASGPSIRVDSGSRVQLLAGSQLRLQRGAVYVDSGSTAADGAVEILTPVGAVREIGTQFEVRLRAADDAVRVRVREGTVSVSLGRESHAAARGEEITLQGDGSIARRAVAPDGPEWQWVLAAAPALDIEGRSLDSYLDWIARETGWRIQYADTALERSADTILLHGTIEGLRPDESVAVILQGSGLDHRRADGVLEIFRP